ncbi:MAG: polyketide synthase dehydratase domain-containing protein [Deltaproteobacteria bacterium]|nr:polyketide synthase dehydratase domain-containing protein [Deltaproteobacteria bacterium]
MAVKSAKKTTQIKREPAPVRRKLQWPLTIPVEPYLRDHRFNGQVILSAVEILQRLAVSLQSHCPDAPVRRMQSASFERFLTIEEDCRVIEACHEAEIHENGRFRSRLTTVGPLPGKTVRRTKVHAVVDFVEPEPDRDPLPMDLASSLEGVVFDVPVLRLYEELVPFGPAYRSLTSLFLSESGALGRLLAPEYKASAPLGSPFPFDGALHAACAWGQRFRHIIAFPVGFEERTIFVPTKPGGAYICRVLPVATDGGELIFDIRIYAPDGALCEDIRGVVMKDVFGGRNKPPNWIGIGGGANGRHPADREDLLLARIRKQCRALSVIEIRAVADFADQALSPAEQARSEKMGRKRKASFVAGRLALKRLSRQLNGGDSSTPASGVHTIMPDGVRPRCPAPPGSEIFCSLSHDARFAVAAAVDEPVGIDVEQVSDRILKTRHLFMTDEEMALTERSPLGAAAASIRVWSVKEAVSKLMDRPLAESWHAVSVYVIGRHMSRLTVNGERYTAFHDAVDDHVFTLIKKAANL